jgi:flagellar hook-length control protein FliK
LVVVDLHLTNLGSMWITIQSSGTTCNCAIRTDNAAARGALDEGAPVLEAGLRRAGFAAAQVRTEAWDGDRVSAAAALFAQTAAFEAEA